MTYQRIPPMPEVKDPPRDLSGDPESAARWARDYPEVVAWFLRHHAAVGTAVRVYNQTQTQGAFGFWDSSDFRAQDWSDWSR
jgi:hypothetical protein